jgi:nucleotide-binding universal stress UspA family protein
MTTFHTARHLLVAYDGTAPSRRGLTRVSELARPGDCVRVINVMPYPTSDGAAEQRARQENLLEHARRALGTDGLVVDTVAAEGDTATEILAAADTTGADLIVTALDRERFPHVPGSITDTIVRRAHCDVYVVYAHPDLAPRR